MKIEELHFNKMIENKLKMIGKIYYIDELISYNEDELLAFLSSSEIETVESRLKENGLYLHMVKSVSNLGLKKETVSFLRDSYIHTLDELLLSKDIDLYDHTNEIDESLSKRKLIRVCNSKDKIKLLRDIKIRSLVLKYNIYEFRTNKERNGLSHLPDKHDSVRVLGGKCEFLEAMGIKVIDDILKLNRREFLQITLLLGEDNLLDKLHELGFTCAWEFDETYKDAIKLKQLYIK
ncbi:MAG: hypothetical protein IKF01_04500 [Bacilli bacterium]|nr:hypothetical protein [Bacilli bacterium]